MGKQKYPNTKAAISDGTAKTGSGRKSYRNAKLHARISNRRQEAEARQREYDGLSISARIARAKSRQGESKREIARLEKALATQKAPAVKQAPLTEAQKSAKAVKRAQASAIVNSATGQPI
jgi:hypothetical protein